MTRATILALALTGCASVFDVPYATKAELLDASLQHVDMERVDRLDAVAYIGDPLSVDWLCKQMGATSTGRVRGCQFVVIREGLQDPVIVVPRDDRTGEAEPDVLAHERCHAKGGSERECQMFADRSTQFGQWKL